VKCGPRKTIAPDESPRNPRPVEVTGLFCATFLDVFDLVLSTQFRKPRDPPDDAERRGFSMVRKPMGAK
jgi:hypothetical protein